MSAAPKIKVDVDNGEGSVVFPPEWNELAAITRADILSDVIAELVSAYNATVGKILAVGNSQVHN